MAIHRDNKSDREHSDSELEKVKYNPGKCLHLTTEYYGAFSRVKCLDCGTIVDYTHAIHNQIQELLRKSNL